MVETIIFSPSIYIIQQMSETDSTQYSIPPFSPSQLNWAQISVNFSEILLENGNQPNRDNQANQMQEDDSDSQEKLRSEIEQLRNQLSEKNAQVNELTEKLDNLQIKFNRAEKQCTILNEIIQSKKHSNSIWQTMYKDLRERSQCLQDRFIAQRQSNQCQLNLQRKKNDNLQTLLRSAKQQYQQEANQKCNEQFQKLNRRIEEQTMYANDYREISQRLQSSNIYLRQKNQRLIKNSEQDEIYIEDLLAQIQDLKRRNDELSANQRVDNQRSKDEKSKLQILSLVSIQLIGEKLQDTKFKNAKRIERAGQILKKLQQHK